MNSDVWRTPDGRIGTEVDRGGIGIGEAVKLAMPSDTGTPEIGWFWADQLKPETPRYEGARGGRVSE